MLLALISGALWIAVWAGLHIIGFQVSGARVFAFSFAFCVAGGLDALWRLWLVWAARKRWRRAGRIVDRRVSHLMHYAALNDNTILLQLAVALFFALDPWTN